MSGADPRRELPGYDACGRWVARTARWRRATRGVPVLLYHSVAADRSPDNAWRWNVTPETFAQQMEWLAAEGYQAIGTEDWRAWAAGNEDGGRRVLITFDDGFRNNLETALPVLRRHGFRAVFFIATGHAGSAEGFPWVKGAADPAAFRPLARDEVKELAAAGMEIGAHTRGHVRLAAVPDDQARDEIAASKRDLEDWLGRPVSAFAYPYGSAWDIRDRHAAFCREAGFATAFTTRPVVSRRGTPPLAVPRMTVLERDGTSIFAQKVRGWFEGYERVRKVLRKLRG